MRDRSRRSTRLPADVDAVGHRVVHGGDRFREPVVIDESVLAELDAITELAPLHNPPSLTAIETARGALPDVPHVAVFDTAFHATLARGGGDLSDPRTLAAELRLHRFGFQGISAQWAAEQVRVPTARRLPPRRRVVRHRRPRRPLGRHDDGSDAARGLADGEPIGLDRPRAPPLSPAPRARGSRRARARAATRVGTARSLRALAARARARGRRGRRETSGPRWR